MRAPSRRTRRILLVVVALLVINVPYALHRWRIHQVGSEGIPVTATVVSADRAGDDVVLGLRFPAAVDPDQKVWSARVDGAAGAAAEQSGQVDVKVLEGHPSVFELEGQQRGHAATILTLGANAVLLMVVLLSWRLGGRLRRPSLVAVALGDAETGDDGSLLDKQVDGTYIINGEIVEAAADSLLLTLRDRNVTVHLQGHTSSLGVGERARIHAHLVG